MSHPETVTAGFDYSSATSPIELPQLAKAIGGSPADIKKDTSYTADVLWDGFFGVGEGPAIATLYTKSETLALNGVAASVTASRKTLLGIPLEKPSILSRIEATVPGKMLTALAAYVTKLNPERGMQTPYIRLPYTGEDLRQPRSHLVRQPFGIPGVMAAMIPAHAIKDSLYDQQQPLFFAGTMTVRGAEHTELSEVMLGQMAVIDRVTDSDAGFRAVEDAYGGYPAAVAVAWHHAMAKPSPRHAAEHILETL